MVLVQRNDLQAIHGGLLWATLVLSHSWDLLSMATNSSGCRPPRHRLAETWSRPRVTCLLFMRARTWSAVPLLPTPPRNTKGPFFPILLSASHKDKQENLMAEGLGLFFERDHSLQVKNIIVWLIELNINCLKLVFLVISGTCGCIHIYQKMQTPRHPVKSKAPSCTHS